ncbi:MAG: thiolase family protein [FCB group bacterium]|jgi:acetyl-CoA acetyltransferase family protein|nr:thiolase family protein [FCB group bacterium]
MRDAFIVEAVRTPLGRGREDGALSSIHPVDLLALTLSEVVSRAGVEKGDVEDIISGCVSPTNEQGANIARLALLKAGFPVHVPGVQINRMCGSSQQAVHFASQAIAAGDMNLAIGSGIEMMGRVPMGSDWGVLSPEFLESFPYPLTNMGLCAEKVAERWGLSRLELDEFAAGSHRKAAEAAEKGFFTSQIMPVTVGQNGTTRIVDRDEGIRPNPDVAKMGTLKTVFKENGVITAANSSQISDGAGAVLLASGEKADELGLRKRARIVARVVVGSDPDLTLTGPIPATQKVLEKAGLRIEDIDVIEINEAFASVVLAWAKEIKPPMERVNPNGGAIAMGHPLGATGAVLMTKLLHELERTNARYGLQTMCIGHGMATATIIERVEN